MIWVSEDEQWLHVDQQRWWGKFRSEDIDRPDLIWKTRQFVVRFESKWSVSVIWGYATYSDNYTMPFYDKDREFMEHPIVVEAGVLHADRDGLQPDGEPFAYIDAEQLNTLLTQVSQLGTDERLGSIR